METPTNVPPRITLRLTVSGWFFAIVREVFFASLLVYMLLYVIEDLLPGIVSSSLNLNILLGIVTVSGLVTATLTDWNTDSRLSQADKQQSVWDIFTIVAAGLLGGLLIWVRTFRFGWISLLIAALATVAIIGLAIVIRGQSRPPASEE